MEELIGWTRQRRRDALTLRPDGMDLPGTSRQFISEDLGSKCGSQLYPAINHVYLTIC